MPIRRRSRTRLGTRRAAASAPVGINDRKPRVGVADFLDRHSPQQLAVYRVQSRPRPALRSALDFRVDGFVAAVGDYVHEPGLGFRFPSLSLKPPSEGRYDYIALVPLDFTQPERHCAEIYPQALPALCVEDVHEPTLCEHDLDGALVFVRGSQTRARTLSGARRSVGRPQVVERRLHRGGGCGPSAVARTQLPSWAPGTTRFRGTGYSPIGWDRA